MKTRRCLHGNDCIYVAEPIAALRQDTDHQRSAEDAYHCEGFVTGSARYDIYKVSTTTSTILVVIYKI